ncbi:MAG: RDD family protein, partial [Acidobacteria bacterium]|nr:RDD family protein [Acidobacteriota bacterium]
MTFGGRFLGGLADLAVNGGVLVLVFLGQSLLRVAPTAAQAPAYAVFLLAFSFLYYVVPMAFWGQTPGMASLGLVVRTPEGENLTFPQTSLRWLAAVVTCLLLGLPLLVALTGRSLGDRWSRSRTYR